MGKVVCYYLLTLGLKQWYPTSDESREFIKKQDIYAKKLLQRDISIIPHRLSAIIFLAQPFIISGVKR
uniref:Uncharacterized protein n=1 Tax=Octopus bimaculoides TaxID=37653 RepID=A0A0L8HJM1_OCTBM